MIRAERMSESMQALLDGDDLDSKIGTTLLLIVPNGTEMPRVASLSVGEVYAPSATELYLTLYETSRTTKQLVAGGRALLMGVDDGAIVKVELSAQPLDATSAIGGRTIFRAEIDAVERDEVPYARVTSGIRFELVDGASAVERWQRQLDELKALSRGAAGSSG